MSAATQLPALAAEPSFLAFAQVHLRAARRGEVAVASAFATYGKFCRRTGRRALSRANFGAALLALARPLGGCRAGETITALALSDGEAAPACEAIRAVTAPPAMPSAQRLSRPLPRLLVDRSSLMQRDPEKRRLYDFARALGAPDPLQKPVSPAFCAWCDRPVDDGAEFCCRCSSRLTVETVVSPPPLASAASSITPSDPVADFLATRLIEAPGFVVALESLRAAVRAEDLRFSEVLDRARARGHSIRKNAWGPDFLTDAQLVEPGVPASEAEPKLKGGAENHVPASEAEPTGASRGSRPSFG